MAKNLREVECGGPLEKGAWIPVDYLRSVRLAKDKKTALLTFESNQGCVHINLTVECLILMLKYLEDNAPRIKREVPHLRACSTTDEYADLFNGDNNNG